MFLGTQPQEKRFVRACKRNGRVDDRKEAAANRRRQERVDKRRIRQGREV